MASDTKKDWSILTIRLKLLKIWFLKNLSLFIKAAILVIVILFLTNVIGSEDFLVQVLGIDSVENAFAEGNVRGWENAIAALISTAISVLLFMKKSKSLAIEDIKSRDLKIALIKAKLYFNENGELCKRVEESTNIDIDGDGKIGETAVEDVQTGSLVTGIPKAIGELATILTTKIDTDDKVVEEAELVEKTDENIVTVDEKLYTEEIGAPEVEEDTEEKTLDEKLTELSNEDPDIEKEISTANETTSETTEKKKKKPSFIGEIFRALKLAFAPMKTGEKETKKVSKKEKIKAKLADETAEENSTKIEVVDIETDGESIDVNTSTNIETIETEVTAATNEEATKSIKQKQIEDILKGLK